VIHQVNAYFFGGFGAQSQKAASEVLLKAQILLTYYYLGISPRTVSQQEPYR